MIGVPDTQLLKFSAVGLLLVISAAVLNLQFSEGMFPILSILAFSSGVLLLVTVSLAMPLTKREYLAIIALVLLTSMVYRVMILGYPTTLVGQDPDRFAEWIAVVMDTGKTDVDSDRYSGAPLFLITTAISALLLGVGPDVGMMMYPVLYGVLAPLIAAIVAFRLVDKYRYESAAIAAILGMIAPFVVRVSIWPTAQGFAVALFLVTVYLLARYLAENDLKWYLTSLILILALLFTHDLPILLLFAVLFGILTVEIIIRYVPRIPLEPASYQLSFLVSLLLLLFAVQTIHILEFLPGVARYTTAFHFSLFGGEEESIVRPHPAGGTVPEFVLFDIFRYRTYLIVSLLAGGISWLAFAITKHNDYFARVILVTIAVSVGFTIILFPADIGVHFVVGHDRIYILAELLVMAIVGSGLVLGLKRGNGITIATVVFAVVILLFLSFSGISAPDHPNTPRYYLTEGETSAKEFGNEYAVQTVYTDNYYGSETIDFDGSNNQPTNYASYEYELFEKTIADSEFEHIAYRTDVGVYRLESGLFDDTNYRLNWDPEPTLDSTSNRIFDNEQVVHYKRSYSSK